MGEAGEDRLELRDPLERPAVVGCVDELGLAVAADADAGLRMVDAPAALALPDLDRVDGFFVRLNVH